MSKFNVTDRRAAIGKGPITAVDTAQTYEHGQGYSRDTKSELFLLAVANMVGEDTFYEKAGDRDARYEKLVREVAIADAGWMLDFLTWLRTGANMRSASLVGAAEAVKARLDVAKSGRGVANGARNRQLINAVLQRADEPGELLAYWTQRYGRAVPKPVKRGIADAVRRLYTEYTLLKYDTASKGYRFADVLDLVHPEPKAPWQGHLFKYALDRRHNRPDNGRALDLPMVTYNVVLRAAVTGGGDFDALLDAEKLREAGMTWEDVLSLAGSKVDKAKLWTALIPTMGYMALLRNLRNFDEAGVPDDVAERVAKRLSDPEQVAKSRQFPFRFLAAYESAPSLRWAHPLDRALNASLTNVPELPGRSLVLVDTSASMTSGGFSKRSTMTPAKAAAVFGVTLALRSGADLYGFADGVFRHDVPKGASAMKEIAAFLARTGEVGHGTRVADSVRATWKGHDRVFIISDMQTFSDYYGGVTNAVPQTAPMYGFNLGGYKVGAIDAGATNRVELGGLTDATFRMIPLLEAGKAQSWPWEPMF